MSDSEDRPGDASGDTVEKTRESRLALVPAGDEAAEMERFMRTEPTGALPEEDDIPPAISAASMSRDALELPHATPDVAMMDTLMGQSGAPAGEPQTQAAPRAQARRKPKKKSRKPLIIGGAVAAGLALWFRQDPPEVPKKSDPRVLGAPTSVDDLTDASKADLPAELEPERVHDEPPPSPPVVKVDDERPSDPREPPPGTPPEIAEVFVRLPVSPADRAPVGGVGKTGIHIDDVAMGKGYERNRCTGGAGPFSVARDDLANVCLRVVHQRQKEELAVVWQKIGGHARRGKIVVRPTHAYRTRAYLKLRGEYVGQWEVRIFSDDNVELARAEFSVVP